MNPSETALSRLPEKANYGFSLGINDVIPGPILSGKKDSMVAQAYAECQDLITRAKKGLLENKPGCDQDQTLEALISSVLSNVRDKVGEICMKELSRHNAPLIMATCGSKGKHFRFEGLYDCSTRDVGSVINVSQMVACVGQQIIAGHRVPDGFQDRSLPHFPKKSREPPSKGFVRNSFFTGLSPTEFLFHAISGREGLVDTAVKTAETGYMQRRLMKALEDLVTHYDSSVRNATGGVVQFRYGDDGLDPACLEGDAQPVEYARAWSHATVSQYVVVDSSYAEKHPKSIASRNSRGLLPFEILEFVDRELEKRRFTSECTAAYLATIRGFISEHVAIRLAEIRASRGMFDALQREEEWDEDTDLSMGASGTF